MKIHSTTPAAATGPAGVPARPDGAAPSGLARQSAGSAQVELSSASRSLLAMQNGDGDIDMQKVAAIREAIARGELRIDAGRIADGLLASARELLQ